ncbi:alpha/beta hydrolase [Streptacidiphilus jiangxiensis]|uniref:TAP-like protein n=1 Tax=Streptacidiphilus jiangxiensis TaxID=235985 RepID=A0A1H7HKJ9_STRJI|nr:alpha/beta hydrolase [Streptacidiphilus jiangxiensis]SEK50789.1 TAP-like protein [Streptacidiphilus jiangxiensis]
MRLRARALIAVLATALTLPAAQAVSADLAVPGHRAPPSRPAARTDVASGTAAGTTAGTTSGTAAGGALQVGSVRLTPCGSKPSGWCGKVQEPLDRSDPTGPTIGVAFEWFPATGPTGLADPVGTVVAVDGGPGWGSTSSRAAYLAMLGPLRTQRNLLVLDLRGTGRSGAITCQALQDAQGSTDTDAFRQAVGACGDQLDHTWKHADGSWVHAADLFGTAQAARDLADVLAQLALPKVDLYGDSYGTWFAQSYASRYPRTLNSVTLDASYEVLGLDPWYRSSLATARTAFGLACARSSACAAGAPRDPWAAISQLATLLRSAPVSGTTTDLNGHTVGETVTTATLLDLVTNAGSDPAVYKGLPAAADAVLDDGDPAPLLRLAAQSVGYDNTTPPPPAYSDGLYFAVACTDYPQLFDRSAPPDRRAEQLRQAVAGQPASAFSPFTASEWTGMNAYTNTFTGCLDWPAPVHTDPPVTATPPLVPGSVPVLVLGGDLDSLTPAVDGQRVAQQMGPSARFVGVPNLTHITAMADAAWPGPEACGQRLYRQFTADPGSLGSLDTGCTAGTTPIAALAAYPALLADVAPAAAGSGNQADPSALRAAAAGVATVDDALTRYGYLSGTHDLGPRGGSWSASASGGSGGSAVSFAFHGTRWVGDATTDGTARWDRTDGTVTARLTVHRDGAPDLTVTASWNTVAPTTTVTLAGTVTGASLQGTMAQP